MKIDLKVAVDCCKALILALKLQIDYWKELGYTMFRSGEEKGRKNSLKEEEQVL